MLTDPMGLVPHSQKWLEYWDRQYYLYISGQDNNAIWLSSIEAFRAVMRYAEQSSASMVGRYRALNDEAYENDSQQASAT